MNGGGEPSTGVVRRGAEGFIWAARRGGYKTKSTMVKEGRWGRGEGR
jgi:hypothetical protein